MNSCIATDYPTASSQIWAPTSTTTSSGSTARTAGSTSDTSQFPILGPTDKSSAPMGWCSMLSRSGYTMLLTPKEASGSRNYPSHSGGYGLSPPSQRGNPPSSWSTAPKQSSLPTSYGTRQQWSIMTKVSQKTADELTSTASKKLAALPSSNLPRLSLGDEYPCVVTVRWLRKRRVNVYHTTPCRVAPYRV
jgi:hypothetical protein